MKAKFFGLSGLFGVLEKKKKEMAERKNRAKVSRNEIISAFRFKSHNRMMVMMGLLCNRILNN